ncbi:MAG: hypothetical protein LQ346_004836 [Caloplaca aetnensis]|nr:MAG: hypothetical protein LQ346_004836 [Caloplaca aetnensis]
MSTSGLFKKDDDLDEDGRHAMTVSKYGHDGLLDLSSIWIPRSLLLLVTISNIVLPEIYQPGLDLLYTALRHSSIYTASTFETWWTVFLYAFIEASYTYRYARNPHLRLANRKANGTTSSKPIPKLRRPRKRIIEGLTYIFPLLLLDLTLIKKYGGVPVHDMALSGNYHLSSLNKTIHGTFLAPTLHNFTLSSPLQTRRALPVAPPTSRELVLQLATSLFIYDTLFFGFHLILHHPFFASVHNQHHNHQEINPQVTNQLDVFERLGLVLLANFSLNIIGSHVLTRTVFVALFVWLLVDIHSGMDLPWGYDKILPNGWAAGSKRHSMHHRFGNKYYEPFFNWWDNAYERIHKARKRC